MNDLIWVDIFFGFMITMMVAVPRAAVKEYIAIALAVGFGQSMFVTGLLVSILGLWKFNYSNTFSLDGVPVFIAMSWSPVLIIYAYYLSRLRKKSEIYAYVLAFSLATTLFVYWLVKARFLFFLHWSDFMTFIMAVSLFTPVTYFLVRHRSDLSLDAEN